MFENLVESGYHREEIRRKSKFIGGTTLVVSVAIFCFVLWGIIFYPAQIDVQNLELVALVAPVPVPQAEKAVAKQEPPKAQRVDINQHVDKRKELVADVSETKLIPKEVGIKASDVPPVRRGVATIISSENSDAAVPISRNASIDIAPPAKIEIKEAPPPPKPTPRPTPHAPVSGGVMNGKAIRLTQPPYPPIAKSAHASGQVVVEVQIDENGNVIEAHASSGHPLLQAVAVAAARSSKFSPTLLSGQPVKVNGKIIYNFVPQ